MSVRSVRLCIVDMNSAHVNQAMRCLRGLVSNFFDHVLCGWQDAFGLQVAAEGGLRAHRQREKEGNGKNQEASFRIQSVHPG